VYGEDSYDGGGVYGADFGNGSPPAPIVITKIERRPSKDVTSDKTISETTKESKKSKSSKESTPKEPSTAKSSRKQSKDTLMAADLEKAYLISAVNECHGNIEETTTATTVKTPDSISSAQSTTKQQQQQQHKTTKFSPNEVDIDEEKHLIKATSVEDQQQHQVESQEPTTSTANHRSPHHHHHHHHQPTTPRKPAFNPLHVILKDKNKYHTTEYI
jgi:hypothetical protein